MTIPNDMENRKLIYALYGIKTVLNDLGIEDIKNEIELKDGTKVIIDCYKEIELFVVNYINKTSHENEEMVKEDEKL